MTEGGKKKGRNAEEHSSRKKTREKARTTGLGRGWVGGGSRQKVEERKEGGRQTFRHTDEGGREELGGRQTEEVENIRVKGRKSGR